MDERTRILTEQFYTWEVHGRGLMHFPHHVPLEPPFRPFTGHQLPKLADDGRTPSLIERLFTRATPPPQEHADDSEPTIPEPITFQPLTPLQLILPAGARATPEQMAGVLWTLEASERLAFEVHSSIAGPQTVLSVPTPQRQFAEAQLTTYFPEIVCAPFTEPIAGEYTAVLEYGLTKEFMLPLVAPRGVEPLAPFLGTLRSLGAGESGRLQLLFCGARAPWAQSILRAVTTTTGEPFFSDFPELTKHAAEKVASHLFAVVIRIGASAPTAERVWEILLALDAGFTQFHGHNTLAPLANDDPARVVRDLTERTTHRPGMLLSLAELLTFVHPLPGTTPERTNAAPERHGTLTLGTNTHAGVTRPVTLTTEDRLRHLHIIGASGTGKSHLLADLISQDIAAGRGVGVIDPHGDLIDTVVGTMGEERLDEVIVLDPAAPETVVGWNILEAHTPIEKELLSSDLVAVFQRLATSWGDQMTAVLSHAVLTFLESKTGGTLIELRRFLTEPAFRQKFLTTVQDPYLIAWWEHDFPLLIGKKPQNPILTRLSSFVRSPLIRDVVTVSGGLNFRNIIDHGQVFLAKLSQGAIGEQNAALLGTLLVSKFHQVARSRQDLTAVDRRPYHLYIDEFHEMATPAIATLFSGIRKYGLALTVAHQSLSQLKTVAPEVEQSLLANAHTRICFRLSEHDARILARGFATFSEDNLVDLSIGEALARIGRRRDDFNLRTTPPSAHDLETLRARSQSRIAAALTRHGTPRKSTKHQHATEAQTSPSQTETPPPEPPPGHSAPIPGRGGPDHKYLQQRIKTWGEERGFRAAIEHTLPTGGHVDVLLTRGDEQIACEISVTTSGAHELDNIAKCRAAGITTVVVVSLRARLITSLKRSIKARFGEANIHCFSPEELLAFLGDPPREASTVAGYKVTLTHRTPNDQTRSRAVTSAVLNALARLKEAP